MASSSRRPIPAVNGDEVDAFSRARKYYCRYSRPGLVKSIKRRYNKRVRTTAKAEIAQERNGL